MPTRESHSCTLSTTATASARTAAFCPTVETSTDDAADEDHGDHSEQQDSAAVAEEHNLHLCGVGLIHAYGARTV